VPALVRIARHERGSAPRRVSRASWPVTVEVVSSSSAMSLPRLVATCVLTMPMTATATTMSASTTQSAASEPVAALASVYRMRDR
jgi:hypothetical protein